MLCVLCGHEKFGPVYVDVKDWEYGTYHSVQYATCENCGSLIQEPLPDHAVIPSFYPSTYRTYQSHAKGLFSRLKSIQEHTSVKRISKIIGGNFDCRILEVGCGTGMLLSALQHREYHNLSGIDFGSAFEKKGIRFWQGDIETEFPFEETFDVIIMRNVLEHFRDPIRILAVCRDHLAAGGRVIILTPNADSLALRLFGKYWAGFHAPRHIMLFSEKTLDYAARKTGFQKLLCFFEFEPGQWSLSIQNMLQDTPWGKTVLKNGLAWYANVLSILVTPLALLQNLTSRGASIWYVFQKEG